MKTTPTFKLVPTILALALTGVSGASLAAPGSLTAGTFQHATAYPGHAGNPSQDASNPPDCKKTPEDPRCNEKK